MSDKTAIQATCKQLWKQHKDSRMADIRQLWEAQCRGEEDPELGELNEYGLCFDYVTPETFNDQLEGYWRYQISYGGPSEEFRFYSSGVQFKPYRVEYWYMDWFDGHGRGLQGEDLLLMIDLWEDWRECGTLEYAYNQALEV